MKTCLALLMAASATIAIPLSAQRPAKPEPRPRHAIPNDPPKRDHPDAKPESEPDRRGHPNGAPHARDNRWYGHAAPNDARFHLERVNEHGRFTGIGPSYRYGVTRFDRGARRLWIPGGHSFEIAVWDWPIADAWCWNCGNNFVVYDDPDHIGWLLLYDTRTGRYVHVKYLGL